MSINHCNWPSGVCFYKKFVHSICGLNHLPPTNIDIPSMRSMTYLICPSHLFSNSAISQVLALCPAPTVLIFSFIFFILLSRSSRTGVMVKSISSDHCYIIGVFIIPVQIISTYLLRESIKIIWYWLIFFTMDMVVWRSSFLTAVDDFWALFSL